MKTKFITFLFIMGFVLSVICGFLVANRIMHILTMSIICGIALSAVGFAVFTILEKKVPEFVDFLNELSFRRESDSSYDSDMGADESENSRYRTDLSDASTSFDSGETLAPVSSNTKHANGKFGDHIMIDNIPIKNEPKLMAEAIRTFMAMDEPSTPQK